MCGECQPTKKQGPSAPRWFADGSAFTLAPLREIALETADTVYRHGRGCVLVASFDGAATVQRAHGSREAIGKAAQALAARTGDPVLIGQQVGDLDGAPVFKAVGRVLTGKADPLSNEAFDGWLDSMAGRLQRDWHPESVRMLEASMEALDFDYLVATGERLEGAIETVHGVLSTPRGEVLRAQQLNVSRSLRNVLAATGRGAANMPTLRPRLASTYRVNDRLVSGMLSRHHSFWVREASGRISSSLSAQARAIISDGVRQGLGRDQIAAMLRDRIQGGLQMRGYWRTVASTNVARARSYSIGSTMRAARIELMKFEAVLDYRTTDTCLYLHDKVIPTAGAMEAMEAAIADPDPEGIRWSHPFVRERDGELAVEYPDGTRNHIADITRGGGYSPSREGFQTQFANGVRGADLAEAGVGMPPFHFKCRTTVVPA